MTSQPDPLATGAVVVGRSEPLTPLASEPVALVDLLDRVLARGVVVTGEVTLSIADIDLVHISLRALISSVRPDLFGSDPRERALAPPTRQWPEVAQ